MKTSPVTKEDLERSVLSVPPLARKADLELNVEENRRLVRYLEQGGVSTLLYGGNANLYNIGVSEYGRLARMLVDIAGQDSWVIPSIGPDYGKALDQVAVLRDFAFPTAMLLPANFGSTPAGAATGLRHLSDRLGKPLIAYVKAEGYLEPENLAELARDGVICAIKYAIVRPDPGQDAYLSKLVDVVDRALIVSGIGERPVISHILDWKLTGFTSGSVCIAPRLSTAILRALKAGDRETAAALRQKFIALEDRRDAHSPIRVLHEAVTLAGVADMGPMLPLLTNLTDPAILSAVAEAAKALAAADAEV